MPEIKIKKKNMAFIKHLIMLHYIMILAILTNCGPYFYRGSPGGLGPPPYETFYPSLTNPLFLFDKGGVKFS